jgi:hypothetical protein
LLDCLAKLVSATQVNVDECVAALVAGFPIEDIWLLEPGKAKECHLVKPINLIVILTEGSEPHVISAAIEELIRKRAEWSGIEVFVFPLSAITRIPRPLLVKMALSAGTNIYSK